MPVSNIDDWTPEARETVQNNMIGHFGELVDPFAPKLQEWVDPFTPKLQEGMAVDPVYILTDAELAEAYDVLQYRVDNLEYTYYTSFDSSTSKDTSARWHITNDEWCATRLPLNKNYYSQYEQYLHFGYLTKNEVLSMNMLTIDELYSTHSIKRKNKRKKISRFDLLDMD